ncbi:MAG: hypothetical protein H7A25_02065 [Leptospiraceae bacterium]|nr:hypothetical protein [Leptospiraceae bacterium]MCP5498661.1 hypothetical protein [Leptospiraceae bacterium]
MENKTLKEEFIALNGGERFLLGTKVGKTGNIPEELALSRNEIRKGLFFWFFRSSLTEEEREKVLANIERT